MLVMFSYVPLVQFVLVMIKNIGFSSLAFVQDKIVSLGNRINPCCRCFYSKSDSVLFPPHLPKTLPNLVRFVLRSSSNLLILDSSLNVCSRDCISTTRNLSAVRMEALFHEMESTSLEISSALSHRRQLEVEMASAGSERLESLENKLKHALSLERLLGRKLFELRLQLNSVQYLHGVLQSYAEPHLDTDTLLSIAQHNTMYKSRLKNYELLQILYLFLNFSPAFKYNGLYFVHCKTLPTAGYLFHVYVLNLQYFGAKREITEDVVIFVDKSLIVFINTSTSCE